MAETAILFPRATKPGPTVQVWLARAKQARRIALTLSVQDAATLEAYAAECEAQVKRLTEPRRPAIAA
jgi:hypothetical protein